MNLSAQLSLLKNIMAPHLLYTDTSMCIWLPKIKVQN